MTSVGSADNPLRVAVIGSGPAGFYTASHLFRHPDLAVAVDMFDRLPAPFGLVRYGVAPDHPKDKSVVRAYHRTAQHPGYRFFGNVQFGHDISLADLAAHYHQVAFATGAQLDRALGIAGEDLTGNHSAAEFVAWYNGHPDYAEHCFDLRQEHVVIVGMGNVALDVARILCRTHDELARTDIADHALAALRDHGVKNITLVGRRGPAQAAFTPPEIRELGELCDVDVSVPPDEAALDPISEAHLCANPDKNTNKNLATLAQYAQSVAGGKQRRLTLRFFLSPIELLGEAGKLTAVRLVRNEARQADDGSVRARATGIEETLSAGLVFRSVGYRGVALPGVPFNEARGVIENDRGRVTDAAGATLDGLYAAGWIKRGPTGVIGTNKTCARETVDAMLEDLAQSRHLHPQVSDSSALPRCVQDLGDTVISYQDWQRIDSVEIHKGEAAGRPRVKFTRIEEALQAAGRES